MPLTASMRSRTSRSFRSRVGANWVNCERSPGLVSDSGGEAWFDESEIDRLRSEVAAGSSAAAGTVESDTPLVTAKKTPGGPGSTTSRRNHGGPRSSRPAGTQNRRPGCDPGRGAAEELSRRSYEA